MTTRRTRSRGEILQALTAAGSFRSAQALHLEMGAAGHRLSLATVYRKLQQLAAEGVIDQAHAEGRETLYRVCGEEGHHHHVVCRTCGDSAPVTGPDFEAWAERVASEAGFIDVDHNLQITGLCRKCQA